MSGVNWDEYQPFRCYFYEDRDCPGWVAGGTCARFAGGPFASQYRIPAAETGEPEPGPWAGLGTFQAELAKRRGE